MNCLGKDRHGNECRNHAIGDTTFCTYHAYLVSYTEDMLANTKLCTGCKKWYCLEANVKTCEKCHERQTQNRTVAKQHVILCKAESCKYKRSKENEYCKLHQSHLLVQEVALRKKRLCTNYNQNGCREELSLEYPFSRCANCLEKERERDRKRRQEAIEHNEQRKESAQDGQEKTCTTCCKTFPIESFKGARGETKCCAACREDHKLQNSRRDREHVNAQARINDKKPERIAVKKAWKEKNYDKEAEKWQRARNKRITTLGVENYLSVEAERAKAWRERNPEKQQESNESRKTNIKIHYSNYKRTADSKNLDFELTIEVFESIVKSVCYYCSSLQERGFNGIDRLNHTKGYVLENCVSCCQMCNYMKNTLSIDVFLRRIEHILTHQFLIKNGEKSPHVFENHQRIYYSMYKSSAKLRELDFQISEDQFKNITKYACYLCGHFPSVEHKNGIDRYDNKIGYVLENCRSCCSDCNIMKKHYEFEELMTKMLEIYHHRIIPWKQEVIEYVRKCVPDEESLFAGIKTESSIPRPVTFPEHSATQNIARSNKKTKEEIKEAARIRKQNQRKRLIERYGNEEYCKMRAKEIRDCRLKKKQKEAEEI